MWLLGRLAPDHKTIAEFRRMHREGDGTLFDRTEFTYQPESTFLCPAGQTLARKQQCGKIVPCSMQHNPKSAEPAL